MARKEYAVKTFHFDGKKYYAYGKTEEEAIEKKILKLQELRRNQQILSGSLSVRDWAIKAIETYKTNQKDITREKYVYRMESCVLRHIGDRSLKSIKMIQLQELINLQTGRSKTHVNEVFNGIKFIFRTAYENKLIPHNPAEFLTKPASYSKSRRAITDHEREILLGILKLDRRFIAFALMLFCGCRPSEARDVKQNDFSYEDGHWLLTIRGTKTTGAVRTVPVPQAMMDLMGRDFKVTCDKHAAINHNNRGLTVQDFTRAWQRVKREMNIKMGAQVYRNKLIEPLPLANDLVPYCLRHTYCTDLLKAGVDLRTAQYLMGHSTIEMTANIYTHIDKDIILKEAQKIIK